MEPRDGEVAAAGTGEHVDTKVDYETVPPSHGAHFAAPAVSDRKFYTAADRPELETLVHNLEHGYTVLGDGPARLLALTAPVPESGPTGWGGFVADFEKDGELKSSPDGV